MLTLKYLSQFPCFWDLFWRTSFARGRAGELGEFQHHGRSPSGEVLVSFWQISQSKLLICAQKSEFNLVQLVIMASNHFLWVGFRWDMPKILNLTCCRFTTLHQTPTFTSQTLNNGVNGTREVGFISSNSFQKLYWNASNGQANLTSNPCYNEEADLTRGLLQKRVISILCVSA